MLTLLEDKFHIQRVWHASLVLGWAVRKIGIAPRYASNVASRHTALTSSVPNTERDQCTVTIKPFIRS